jgi:D-methionine transport system substrate-binding protein
MSTDLHDNSKTPQKTSDAVEIKLGKPRRWLIPTAVAAAVVIAAGVTFAVTSGGSSAHPVTGSHFGTELQVAYEADSGSERAFLEYLDKTVAPAYGVRVIPVGIGDGNQLDQATANGQYAANIYQHKHWLKQVTDKTGWKLTAVGPAFQWAYSVYSAKHASLDAIPHGGKIALLNDPANTAQALWLLQRGGKITFKPGVDPWSATVNDIATNPNAYQFTLIDYGAGPRILSEVDAVIAYNFQFISAGTDPKFKIYAPPAPLEFAGQLVTGTDYLQDPQVKKLINVFRDPQVQPYLANTTDPALKDQLSPVSSA